MSHAHGRNPTAAAPKPAYQQPMVIAVQILSKREASVALVRATATFTQTAPLGTVPKTNALALASQMGMIAVPTDRKK